MHCHARQLGVKAVWAALIKGAIYRFGRSNENSSATGTQTCEAECFKAEHGLELWYIEV
jgi:hypothetical protein